MRTQPESQIKTLLNHLLTGSEIDRVSAFKSYGIADLRSRISECERVFNVTIERGKIEGKKYVKYFIKSDSLVK